MLCEIKTSITQPSQLSGPVFQYDKNAPAIHYILKTLNKTPPNLKILFNEETQLSPTEIIERVEKCIAYLQKKQVKLGDTIALYFAPSCELITTILSLLRMGVCFVILDERYPLKHMQRIIKDSKPKYLIANCNNNIEALSTLTDIVNYKEISDSNKLCASEPPYPDGNTSAYVIYTSGSTSTPKGIIIPNRAINNHMLWMTDNFKVSTKDNILFKTPPSFDPSIWEMLLPFYSGCQLYVAPGDCHTSAKRIIHYIKKHQITIIQLVPIILDNLLSLINHNECDALKIVFVGGDNLTRGIKVNFFKKMQCSLVNLYGPAEATIDTTYHQVTSSQNDINVNTIGSPIYNVSTYVLNEKKELCGVGIAGELYVSGDGIALGYLNNDELTKSCFLPNPFNKGSVMYKTGDIAKQLAGGALEYLGRNDRQIKIGGVRLEVESLIYEITKFDEVLDCYIEKKLFEGKYPYLIAYLFPRNGKQINLYIIRESLEASFPRYMLPKKLVTVTDPTMLQNGKLDYKRILAEYSHQHTYSHHYVTEKIRSIFQQCFCNDAIDFKQSFTASGGDSITCMSLVASINSYMGISIPEDLIINARTLDEVISQIVRKKYNEQSDIISLNSPLPDVKLFLIHPIGGTIFWYKKLATLLNNKIAIYAIQDPGIRRDIEFQSIKDMASYYLELIKTIQGRGPYFIGGASFGATVAAAIADILKGQRETVGNIFVFDGWASYPENMKNLGYFRTSMLRQQQAWKDKFKIGLDQVSLEKLFDRQCSNLELLFLHSVKKSNHKISLFKSREIMPIFEKANDPYNHWDKYTDNIIKYLVPGNHETMFERPNVTALTELILASICDIHGKEK